MLLTLKSLDGCVCVWETVYDDTVTFCLIVRHVPEETGEGVGVKDVFVWVRGDIGCSMCRAGDRSYHV